MASYDKLVYALVAQLDRALGYGPRCREFESLRARHFLKNILIFITNMCYNQFALRKVAQFGSARGLGP